MTELVKCGRCHAKKLPEFFSVKKTTGKMFKTCTKCRERVPTKQCSQCEAVFKEKHHLESHIKDIHEKKDKKCPQCDAIFSRQCHVESHIKFIHEKIKNIKCPQCEMIFVTIDNMYKHIRSVHNDIRDYHCEFCDATFHAHAGLMRHIKGVHDKIKNYLCSECGSGFSEPDTLRRHVKAVHDRIRDNECPTCDFKSCTAGDLRNHMKICTGNSSMSFGEFAIKSTLDTLSIKYERQMRFTDCKNQNGNILPFDFYIPQYITVIEFDGRQHFEPVEHWGGQEALEKTQKHDVIKNAYCVSSGIRLLRIKYTHFDQIRSIIIDFLSTNAKEHVEKTSSAIHD